MWDYIENYCVITGDDSLNAPTQINIYTPCESINETKEDENEKICVLNYQTEKENERIFEISETLDKLEETQENEAISLDMEIDDILSYSNKLLNSVSETLHKVMIEETKIIKPTDRDTNKPKNSNIKNNNEATVKHVSRVSYEISRANLQKNITSVHRMDQINLPECSVRQWAKELVVAVEELHKNNIICG